MNTENQPSDMNAAVMKTLRRQTWFGRALAGTALGFGLLSIAVSILLAIALMTILFPHIRSMVIDYTQTAQQVGTNSIAHKGTNSMEINLNGGGDVNWRHVEATLGLGKAVYMISLSLILLGAGTLLTLVLTIFNRRITLRQINISLAQISNQIKELQHGQSDGRQ